MTGERAASQSKSTYTHEACTQVGVHGEENANESSGQVDKLLPHPWLSIADRQSKQKQRIAELQFVWYNASDTTIVMNQYARISGFPALPLPSRILLA